MRADSSNHERGRQTDGPAQNTGNREKYVQCVSLDFPGFVSLSRNIKVFVAKTLLLYLLLFRISKVGEMQRTTL